MALELWDWMKLTGEQNVSERSLRTELLGSSVFEGQGEEDGLAKESSKWPMVQEKDQEGGCGDLEIKGRKFFKSNHVKCCSGLKNMDVQHRCWIWPQGGLGNLDNYFFEVWQTKA